MKIKDEDFKKYFNIYSPEFKRYMNSYLENNSSLSKDEVNILINELYTISNKSIPSITWMTLDEFRNEFYDDSVNIITTIDNINWVMFYVTFLEFINKSEFEYNKTLLDIYNKNLHVNSLLFGIMINSFGFVEINDELILIEKPEHIYHVNYENKLHNIYGPTIEIGDYKEFFLQGECISSKEWSKRLRIALIDPNDDLIKYLDSKLLSQIRGEVNLIDGDDAININEPKIFVFYLDREIFRNQAILDGFTSSVNAVFSQRHFNAIAFFMPTDGEERIECINPQLISDVEYIKVKNTLKECQKLFDIGNN